MRNRVKMCRYAGKPGIALTKLGTIFRTISFLLGFLIKSTYEDLIFNKRIQQCLSFPTMYYMIGKVQDFNEN